MSDRYTLAEARHLIAVEDCGREGHHPSIEYKFGSPDPYTLICSRCGQIWHVATREEVLGRQNDATITDELVDRAADVLARHADYRRENHSDRTWDRAKQRFYPRARQILEAALNPKEAG